MYSREGQEMVDVKKISREGENLVMKAKLMGAYSMNIYLSPAEMRSMLTLLSWEVLKYVPEMMVVGTKGEETLREIAKNFGVLTSQNLKLVFGEGTIDRMGSVAKEIGLNSIESLVNNALLLADVILENRADLPGKPVMAKKESAV
jgi:DNA-binding transcriptional regulator LsrR (DeoR family)